MGAAPHDASGFALGIAARSHRLPKLVSIGEWGKEASGASRGRPSLNHYFCCYRYVSGNTLKQLRDNTYYISLDVVIGSTKDELGHAARTNAIVSQKILI